MRTDTKSLISSRYIEAASSNGFMDSKGMLSKLVGLGISVAGTMFIVRNPP
jgi:hypothetical protein